MLFVVVMLAALQGCEPTGTSEPGDEFFDKLGRACVEVLADGKMAGSGAFVSSDGYVLTAGHFITGPEMKLEVLSTTAGRKAAKLVAIDKGHDIALLKIEAESELEFLTISEQGPQRGQAIYVIGSPLNRHRMALGGRVASAEAVYEYLTDQGTYIYIWYIQAMSPRGLSGGNWVNSSGQIVGVQSGFLNDDVTGGGSANSGVAFMAGSKAIERLIRTKKHAQTPSLGGIVEELWTQAPGFQTRFGEGAEGIVIHQVRAGGPLEKAGLVHEDLIVEADGKKMRYREELLGIVRNKKVGDTVEIGFVKPDGKGAGKKEVILDCLEQNWLDANVKP